MIGNSTPGILRRIAQRLRNGPNTAVRSKAPEEQEHALAHDELVRQGFERGELGIGFDNQRYEMSGPMVDEYLEGMDDHDLEGVDDHEIFDLCELPGDEPPTQPDLPRLAYSGRMAADDTLGIPLNLSLENNRNDGVIYNAPQTRSDTTAVSSVGSTATRLSLAQQDQDFFMSGALRDSIPSETTVDSRASAGSSLAFKVEPRNDLSEPKILDLAEPVIFEVGSSTKEIKSDEGTTSVQIDDLRSLMVSSFRKPVDNDPYQNWNGPPPPPPPPAFTKPPHPEDYESRRQSSIFQAKDETGDDLVAFSDYSKDEEDAQATSQPMAERKRGKQKEVSNNFF